MDTDAGRQRSTLRRIAHRAMIERGLLPDFSRAALAELDGIRATPAGESRRAARHAQPALGFDRQRRFPRPGPAHRRRDDAGGRGEDPRRDRGRGRPREEGLGDRRSRPAQHHLGLYRRRDLSHASREALDRSHVAWLRGRPPGHRHRDGGRRGWGAARLGSLRGDGPQPREAGLQQRRGLAGGRRPRPGADRGRRGARREPPHPGPRGAEAEGVPARARGAGPGNDRGAAGIRRGCDPGPGSREEEPGEGADRGFHDRGQRGDRAIPERQKISLPAARGPLPEAVGADRRGGVPVRRNASAGARSEGARAISGGTEGGRSAPLSRSLAHDHQADGGRRIRAPNFRRRRLPAISGSRSGTTRTPRRRTADTPI